MSTYRYYKWDGTEPFKFDKDRLMEQLSRKLFADGNLSRALWQLQTSGMHDVHGRQLPSLKELIRRLQEKRQSQLNRYNLDSIMDDIRKALDDVLQTERAGIKKKMDEMHQKVQQGSGDLPTETLQKLLNSLKEKADQNLQHLNSLPGDIGGKIKVLSEYDFMDEEARRKFNDLMDMIKKRAMDTYVREMGQSIKNLDPATLSGLKQMLRSLNEMLEQRVRGQEPDFESFMKQYGAFFGPDPPRSLDDLLERLQQQVIQAQSLLNSLSTEQRSALEALLNSVLDDDMRYELDRLGTNLQILSPYDLTGSQYDFLGRETISYSEALKLMELLQKMDQLESQLKNSRYTQSIDEVDKSLVRELLGEQSAEDLEAIESVSRILEQAGYIRRENGEYKLTPRGMRKIGEKALDLVFSRLKKDRVGGHRIIRKGGGGERLEETRKYEFGDDFDVDVEKTIMNSLLHSPRVPVKLDIDDFEIFQEEQTVRSATVLLLDMSFSMRMYGNFEAAKMVSIALNSLISGKFPKDSLYILGFSNYARKMTPEELTYISWDDFTPYTNMHHAFMMARKLLAKDKNANKQIILITDGQPTAYIENGEVIFQLPTSRRCLEVTLKEVTNCTRAGIVINTFMLQGNDFFNYFVDQMARLNHGRVFFTSAEELGSYLIVDYISNKKTAIK